MKFVSAENIHCDTIAHFNSKKNSMKYEVVRKEAEHIFATFG